MKLPRTASATRLAASRSGPSSMPSRSMLEYTNRRTPRAAEPLDHRLGRDLRLLGPARPPRACRRARRPRRRPGRRARRSPRRASRRRVYAAVPSTTRAAPALSASSTAAAVAQAAADLYRDVDLARDPPDVLEVRRRRRRGRRRGRRRAARGRRRRPSGAPHRADRRRTPSARRSRPARGARPCRRGCRSRAAGSCRVASSARRQHAQSTKLPSIRRPCAEDFSGWNWTPRHVVALRRSWRTARRTRSSRRRRPGRRAAPRTSARGRRDSRPRAARRSAGRVARSVTSFQPMCGTRRPPASQPRHLAARSARARPSARAPPSARTAAASRGRSRAAARPRAARSRISSASPSSLQVAHRHAGTRRRPGTTSPSARPARLVVAGDRAPRADVLERLLAPSGGCPSRSRRRRSVAVTYSVPLVLGTPRSVGSSADAARSARANALNAASIMWCAFVPACTVRCSVSFALRRERAEELLGQLVVEVADRARRQRRLERQQPAPGDVDRARRARLVHRHDRVAVARDSGAIAERPVERLADADPDVLDRVVGAGLRGRRWPERRGRGGRGARAGRACGRGNPTPVCALAGAGAVERQADVDLRSRAVLRSISAVRVICDARLSRMRASIDLAWSSNPSARATGAAARASAAGVA